MIRVLIVENGKLGGTSLARMVAEASDMEVVGLARTIGGVLASLDKHELDVVLADITAANDVLAASIAAGQLGARVVIVAASGEEVAAEQSARFEHESSYVPEVLETIRIVAGKRSPLGTEVVH